jgi:hypothetical protein
MIFCHMFARIYAARNAFLVAGIAAILTFLALLWLGQTGERVHLRDQQTSSQQKRVTPKSPVTQPLTTESNPASLPPVDSWKPAPTEFGKLTAAVSVHNSRGKEVKQFPVGKRLRVSKRAGDQITIDYLGDEYTIPTASTEPSQ